MPLVADGRVDLDAPVRRYVPELVLPDEKAAAGITVLQLLNHTSGLDRNVIVTAGGLAGQRGFFSRDASGAVAGVDLGGRVFGRFPTATA